MRVGDTIDDGGISYMWRRRLAMGALNVIFSRPGRGKSTLAADLAGHVTTGKDWPDGAPCDPGFVLYLKGEGTDASIRDRMRLAGADPKRYGIISKAEGAGREMIDLATDTECLDDLINLHLDTRLIIIDTLDSMFSSMRMIDNSQIRQCLWPLQTLAEKRGVCVVLLAHTNKGGYADPLDRLSGGRAIGAAARGVWYLGKLDHDADECYLASVKVNDYMPAPTLSYQIVGLGPDQPGAIRWGDPHEDVTAWELDQTRKTGDGSSNAARCKVWLSDLLVGGAVRSDEVTRQAQDCGYGDFVLKKAKSALQVQTRAAKGVQPTQWYLCLPDQDPPDLSTSKTKADPAVPL